MDDKPLNTLSTTFTVTTEVAENWGKEGIEFLSSVCPLSQNHPLDSATSPRFPCSAFTANLAVEAYLVALDVPCKSQLQFCFGLPNINPCAQPTFQNSSFAACPLFHLLYTVFLHESFIINCMVSQTSLLKHPNVFVSIGMGYSCTWRTLFWKIYQLSWASLCFKAASHGWPDTGFLKKLKAAHPVSSACTWLLAFLAPPRIFLDCFSWISSDVLSSKEANSSVTTLMLS